MASSTILSIDTDWGEEGARASGRQVQDFLKHHIKKLTNETSKYTYDPDTKTLQITGMPLSSSFEGSID